MNAPNELAPLAGLGTLPPIDYQARLARLSACLPNHEVDGLLVTKLEHIRYLTGFTGSAALLLVGPEGATFVTDGRYDTQSREQLGRAGVAAEIVVTVEQKEAVAAASSGMARVGLEAASVTWAAQRRYAADWFPDAEVTPTEGIVEGFRAAKEPAEVARIELAAAIADAALALCLPALLSGPSEEAFAFELESTMRRLGSPAPAFETIIAAGENSAKPHHRPSSRPIRRGDLVVVDFGATVEGYKSDMTRTVCVGPPTASQQRLYDVVLAAHEAGKATVRPGIEAKEVDTATREPVAEAGWADQFPHGTGHGVGLEIHEAPYIGRTSTATIEAFSIVTVEPGVYLEGVGGVRTEDTLVVTSEGWRPLTRFPKSLRF